MTILDLPSLRRAAHRVLALPAPAQAVVEGYQNLRVQGTTAACPYHINPGLRAKNRALLGKGRPTEIQATAERLFDQFAMHVRPGHAAELRAFLQACGLGIDCSGFASWVLNGVTQHHLHRPLWQCLAHPSLRSRLAAQLRPIENISARTLTSSANASAITNLATLRPADLLRLAGGHHVVIVTEVGQDKSGAATYFAYAQSSCQYDPDGGVHTGFAVIANPHGSLADQHWHDGADPHIMATFIAEHATDNRAVRLKVLAGATA